MFNFRWRRLYWSILTQSLLHAVCVSWSPDFFSLHQSLEISKWRCLNDIQDYGGQMISFTIIWESCMLHQSVNYYVILMFRGYQDVDNYQYCAKFHLHVVGLCHGSTGSFLYHYTSFMLKTLAMLTYNYGNQVFVLSKRYTLYLLYIGRGGGCPSFIKSSPFMWKFWFGLIIKQQQ